MASPFVVRLRIVGLRDELSDASTSVGGCVLLGAIQLLLRLLQQLHGLGLVAAVILLVMR